MSGSFDPTSHQTGLRYVVLAHEAYGAFHFDVMFEAPSASDAPGLRSFRTARWPVVIGQTVEWEQIAEHRAAYLDYEGELSDGRGAVRRVESGVYRCANAASIPALADTQVIGDVRICLRGHISSPEIQLMARRDTSLPNRWYLRRQE